MTTNLDYVRYIIAHASYGYISDTMTTRECSKPRIPCISINTTIWIGENDVIRDSWYEHVNMCLCNVRIYADETISRNDICTENSLRFVPFSIGPDKDCRCIQTRARITLFDGTSDVGRSCTYTYTGPSSHIHCKFHGYQRHYQDCQADTIRQCCHDLRVGSLTTWSGLPSWPHN